MATNDREFPDSRGIQGVLFVLHTEKAHASPFAVLTRSLVCVTGPGRYLRSGDTLQQSAAGIGPQAW